MNRFIKLFYSFLIVSIVACAPIYALSPSDFPSDRPNTQVFDNADVLSLSTKSEIEKKLDTLGNGKLDARLITLRGLDYGYSLGKLGEGLINRWTDNSQTGQVPLLLFIIETGNNQSAIIADEQLDTQLPISIQINTAKTTMNLPLKDGQKYRKASIEAIERIDTVLNGGDDPGPPLQKVFNTETNIPTKEEVSNSNATIWVIGLLVIGTIVPMATWWWFSR